MTLVPQLDYKLTAPASETDLIFVFQDSSKKPVLSKGPYASLVGKFRQGGGFDAKAESVRFVPFGGKGKAKHVLLVGLGPVSEIDTEKARLAGAYSLSQLKSSAVKTVNIQVDTLLGVPHLRDPIAFIRGFSEGLFLAAYQFDRYKKGSKNEVVGPTRYSYVSKSKGDSKKLSALAKDIRAMAECVYLTRDWSNEPCNTGTPSYYAQEASRLAKAHGIKCRVIGEAEAKKEGMNLFLSVGAGSQHEGKMIVLDYHPKGAKKTVALVGKGITFDSGGISIKPSSTMEDMKHDMTGAATMLGAILLAAKRKIQNRVVAILAMNENMPDGAATNPSSVVRGRNGKTVEIINTDAEGRLVLADALDLAHDFKPDCIVNAATLTGAVVIALGKVCCGVMGNNDELIEKLKAAGANHHERMWPLPLYDEYFEGMKTDVADMRNSTNDRQAGTIRAGVFLKQFIKNNTPWAHLDIAATAYGMGHLPYAPKKGASGFHVRTLAQFVEEF